MDRLIEETAERLFAAHVDAALLESADTTTGGAFPAALWDAVRGTGLHLVGSPGSGTDLGDVFGLLVVAGRHAVPLPLAEILVANAVVGDDGLTTIAAGGVATWARAADRVLTVDGRLSRTFYVERRANLAGEARDRVRLRHADQVDVPGDLFEWLALARAAQMAGALEAVLAMTIEHVTERQQFGRPLARFQAVQHSLAVLAGETAAARCACDGAAAAVDAPGFADQAAAAKARAGEAAGVAAEIAHQMHGAMGFAREHRLHHFTRRLWAWRDEYGRECDWQEHLGRRIAAADDVWKFIAGA